MMSAVAGALPVAAAAQLVLAPAPASAATTSGASARHTAQLTSWNSALMILNNAGINVRVTIRGGGAGTSNCTNDETSTSFIADQNPTLKNLGFDAKGSGSCAYEPSFSYFRISVQGWNENEQWFDSSANVRYGQTGTAAGPYRASCGDLRELVRMTCSIDGDRIDLTAVPYSAAT